jgi:hypothetical protein
MPSGLVTVEQLCTKLGLVPGRSTFQRRTFERLEEVRSLLLPSSAARQLTIDAFIRTDGSQLTRRLHIMDSDHRTEYSRLNVRAFPVVPDRL